MTFQERRIRRELKNYDIHIDCDSNSVEFEFEGDRIRAHFLRPYPFNPPIMYKNGRHISFEPSQFPKRLMAQYTKSARPCMCCNTITCPNNWSPVHCILHILREYNTFINQLKIYHKIRIFQDICLPDDIIKSIVSFLL